MPTRLLADNNVIDQTSRADPSSNGDEQTILQKFGSRRSSKLLGGNRIRHTEVVDLEARLLSELVLFISPNISANRHGLAQIGNLALAVVESGLGGEGL